MPPNDSRGRSLGRQLVVIGDARQAELGEAMELLDELGCVDHYERIDDAIQALSVAAGHPSLIVLVQPRRGALLQEDVLRLRGRFPLARMVMLLGSWCEGELRSGSPCPGVPRVLWHAWRERISREMQQQTAGRLGSWGLAATSTADDRGLFSSRLVAPTLSANVVIATDRFDTYEPLAEAISSFGMAVAWLRAEDHGPTMGVDAVVYDAPRSVGDKNQALADVSQRSSGAPILVLSDYPRRHEIDAWRHWGAAAVLNRPFDINDLVACLGRLTGHTSPPDVVQVAAA